eukprot:g1233.t1
MYSNECNNNNNNNNKRNENPTFGRVYVNHAKRSALQKNVAADEEEYNKYISQRPHGGSGVLGGRRMETNNSMYEPDQMAIMETMEKMDVAYDEARTALISDFEENKSAQHASVNQRRKLLFRKVREREKQTKDIREKREQAAKRVEEEKIRVKKARARLQALKNDQRVKLQREEQLRVSQMNRKERLGKRIKNLDQSGSNRKFKVSRNSYSNNNKKELEAATKTSSSAWERRAMELIEENLKLKARNETLAKEINILGTQHQTSPTPVMNHQIYVSSEEWFSLLDCEEGVRTAALEYLSNETQRAESGDCAFPTISYAIGAVKDSMQNGNRKELNGNRLDHEEEERKPTQEELRKLRLSRYNNP